MTICGSWFARIGLPHCPVCGKPVTRQTTQAIIEQIIKMPANAN